MTIALISDPKNIKRFALHSKAVLRQAINGKGEHLEAALADQEVARQRTVAIPGLREEFDRTLARIGELQAAHPSLRLDPTLLIETRGIRLPLIREPYWFDEPLDAEVLSSILAEPELSPEIATASEILGRAVFTAGDRKYRTDFHQGLPTIFGEKADTFRAFAAIAHELGHCLAEYRRLSKDLDALVASEGLAISLEERLLASFLQRRGLGGKIADWEAYQRQVDGLNFEFTLFEYTELFGGEAFEPSFARASVVFRETMFTAPGYQLVYCRASIARAEKIADLSEKRQSKNEALQGDAVTNRAWANLCG